MAKLEADRVKEAAEIAAIVSQYVKLTKQGAEYVGLCPFHKEKTPSFTVTPAKGLFHCFGCQKGGDVFDFVSEIEGIGTFHETVVRVAELVGIDPGEDGHGQPRRPAARPTPRPIQGAAVPVDVPEPEAEQMGKIVAVYPYTDEHGEVLCEVCRVEPGRKGRKKDFLQRVPNGDGTYTWKQSARKVLYRLPAVLKAATVWVVEGEKDVHTLEAAGVVATTNSGGAAQKWLPEYTEALRGRTVVVVPDGDEPGKKRAEAICGALRGAAEVVRLDLPEFEVRGERGKDVTDWIEAGRTIGELQDLLSVVQMERKRESIEKRGLLHPTEIVDLYRGGLDAFLDPSRRKKGILTGFDRFDRMTLGLQEGELFILAARPAMGKTALAMNIASNVADQGRAVAVFSLEMSREQILSRVVCSRARVNQLSFRAGRLDRADRERVMAEFANVFDRRLYIDDAADASLKTVYRKLRTMRDTVSLDLVVIDYLQLMRAGKSENRNLEVGALSRGLKLMARELKIPFVVLSQLSRAPEGRIGNHRPQLSDLRDSGAVEQDADMVAFIFREEVYKPDREDLRGVAELILAKQRNGPIGTVKLVFLRECTRFENMAHECEGE